MCARKFFGLWGLAIVTLIGIGCTAPSPTNPPGMVLVTVTPIAPIPSETPTPAPTMTFTPVPPSPTATSTAMPTVTPTAAATRRPRPPITPTAVPPVILSFTVDRSEIDPGESVTLFWNTSGGDRAVIYPSAPDGRSLGSFDVTPTGSFTLATDQSERLWYQFSLYVYNPGNSVSSSVSVQLRCPYTFFFGPLPAEDQEVWGCPDSPATFSAAAGQAFEHGQLIWLEATKTVYALLDDGALFAFADTWSDGQPVSDPQLAPPAGRYQPVRGFGQVWRTATLYGTSLREQLGWALAPEKAFDGALQGAWRHCCGQPSLAYRPIYLRNSDGRVLRLWFYEVAGGNWQYATP